MKTIQAGQTLTARSICDHECIFTCEILSRKGNFCEVATDGGKRVSRRKVYKWHDGSTEYVLAMGKYSMAPMFRADSAKKVENCFAASEETNYQNSL